MAEDNDEFFTILLLIDELVATHTTDNDDDKGTEACDVLLPKLYAELSSLEDRFQTSSTPDKLEQCFVKLNKLSSLSSSPVFIGCCLIILEKFIGTDLFLHNMKYEKLKSDEYYTLIMDALTRKENLDYLQSDRNFSTDLYKIYIRSYLSLAQKLIRLRNLTSELLSVHEWNSHTACFENKYKPFIKVLLSFIDRKLDVNEDVLSELDFIVSLSDDTNLVPDLIECELPQHVQIWLSTYINKKQFENNDLCESILLITHNVARHEEGSNALKNVHINDALQDFWKLYGNDLSKTLISMYYMTYALIVTPDELKSTTILLHVIDYLIHNIKHASHSPNMRSMTSHISEDLVALARLIVNDNVAQYIINTADGLAFFLELFQTYNDLTPNDLYLKHLSRIALFNILCSFSYQPTAQKRLASNKKFIEIIKNASHYNNEHDVIIQPCLLQYLSSVKQASEAILINLDLYKDEDVIQTSTSSKSPDHPRIMISYSHKDMAFCRDLVQALKANSIDLWVDEDGHCRSEDCWEEIAVAIKYASIILVIVTPNYCQSVACRKEATYADKRKKTLIALYPNDDKYEPDEWLDIRLTGIHVHFGGSSKKRSFDDCISRLLEYIRPKEGDAIMKTQSIEIVPPESSIHDWTKHDVQTWFLIERNLLPQLYKLYSFVDGDSLLEYAKHFIQEHQQDSKQQYEKLYKRLHKEFDIEFYDNNYTDLVCSMKKLLLSYDQQVLSTTNT